MKRSRPKRAAKKPASKVVAKPVRANLKPVVLDGHEPGGHLSLTTHVENFPGFPDGIMGPELIENMRKQAQKFGAEFKAGVVTEVDVRQRPFRIVAGKDTYETKALIVAAGASARMVQPR